MKNVLLKFASKKLIELPSKADVQYFFKRIFINFWNRFK